MPPAELPQGDYRLDPQHATILFKVDHLGFSRLIGRFDRFDATLDFDPQQPQDATLVAVVDPASIDLNLPAFEQDLRGSDWLDVDAIPRRASRAVRSRSPARTPEK